MKDQSYYQLDANWVESFNKERIVDDLSDEIISVEVLAGLLSIGNARAIRLRKVVFHVFNPKLAFDIP